MISPSSIATSRYNHVETCTKATASNFIVRDSDALPPLVQSSSGQSRHYHDEHSNIAANKRSKKNLTTRNFIEVAVLLQCEIAADRDVQCANEGTKSVILGRERPRAHKCAARISIGRSALVADQLRYRRIGVTFKARHDIGTGKTIQYDRKKLQTFF
jgi:hypothetical protein